MQRVYPGWGLAIARVVLGAVFLIHGWDGLFLRSGGSGFATPMPLHPSISADPVSLLLAILEFAGGLLMLAGWLTRWVAIVLFVEVLFGFTLFRLQHGFFVFRTFGEWGYEYHLVLLGGLACLAFAGAGKLAIDDWLVGRPRRT